MKIFVAITAILIVVSAEYEDYENYEDQEDNANYLDDDDYGSIIDDDSLETKKVNWTGNVKTLVDNAQLEPEIILNISKRIFQNTRMNCNGTMRMPNRTFLPSPTAECDLTSIRDLREAVLNPQSFNSEKFLKEFWSSITGGRLLEELQKKGVSEDVVKAAMKEAWFNRPSYRDTAFNRFFLAANINGSNRWETFNTWYTFDVATQNTPECNFDLLEKEPPLVVGASCEGHAAYSWFIYPSHPFVDLLLYTLCIWMKDIEKGRLQKCVVAFPGSQKLFKMTPKIYTDPHGIPFVADVVPEISI